MYREHAFHLIPFFLVISLAISSGAFAGTIDEDVLEFNISCYVDGSLYSTSTMEASPGAIGTFSCGSADSNYGFACMYKCGEPSTIQYWYSNEEARFAGATQHVYFRGVDFQLHSPIADWYEIEVRGCKRSDLERYSVVMKLDNELDESIKNKVFEPLGRITIAATRFDPILWPKNDEQ